MVTIKNVSERSNLFSIDENCFYYLITGICLSFKSIIILFTLPISEIYFGINYGDEVNCSTNIFNLSLKNWLIIKGSISILNIFSFATMVGCGNKSICNYIFYIINNIILTFNIIWLIIGSIIFWAYCKNLEPVNINTLMYFSLILGYIGFLNQIAILNNNFQTEKPKKPLLDF